VKIDGLGVGWNDEPNVFGGNNGFDSVDGFILAKGLTGFDSGEVEAAGPVVVFLRGGLVEEEPKEKEGKGEGEKVGGLIDPNIPVPLVLDWAIPPLTPFYN
jgi:hypothetical protein